ncbi:MAG: hypothetical protein ABL982_14010, partial [Vicinamibacterales bacterium]
LQRLPDAVGAVHVVAAHLQVRDTADLKVGSYVLPCAPSDARPVGSYVLLTRSWMPAMNSA